MSAVILGGLPSAEPPDGITAAVIRIWVPEGGGIRCSLSMHGLPADSPALLVAQTMLLDLRDKINAANGMEAATLEGVRAH